MNNIERNFRKNIGKKIRLARTQSNYTQEQLAEKLSLSPRYISQLERGIAFGSATTIINICKALNITSDYLFQDLIKNDAPILNELIEQDFLENYLKLNKYNKLVVNSITKELARLQFIEKNNNSKKKA